MGKKHRYGITQLKTRLKNPNILTLLIIVLGALISLLCDYLSEAWQRRFGWDLKWNFPGTQLLVRIQILHLLLNIASRTLAAADSR